MKKILMRLGTLVVVAGLLAAFGANTAFAGTTPAISNTTHKNGVARVLVEFNAPVWGDTDYSTVLAAADFQLGAGCSATITSISSVSHAAGNDWAILTVAGTVAADESACTIAAVANSIFTVGGALSEKTLAMDASADSTGPTISSATAKDAEAEVLVTFSEHVFGEADGTAALVNGDFAYDDIAGGTDADACTGTAAGTTLHVAGNDWAVWTCSVALTTAADIDDNEEMDLAGAANVYDLFGNAAVAAQNTNLTADIGAPTFAAHFATKGEATEGGTKFLVKFSEPVFDAAIPALADLANADFAYTNTSGGGAVSLTGTAQQTNDQEWVVLTVNTAFLAADLTAATADTIDEAATAIYDAHGNAKNEAAIALQDNTDPVILSVTFNQSSGANTLAIAYSEKIKLGTLTTGALSLAASTATVLDLSAAGTLQGIGVFGTVGNVTVATTKNTAVLDSGETTITVTLAGVTNAYLDATSTTAPSGTLTPEITGAGIQDKNPNTANDIETTSIQTTLTTTSAWDLTKPTITSAVLTDTYINASTTSAGHDGKVDVITLTASETLKAVASSADTINDWTVASNTTEYGASLTVTSASAAGSAATYVIVFSGANIFYDTATFTVTAAADEWSLMDRAGNIFATTSKVCMYGYVCTGGAGNYAVTTLSIEKPGTKDSTPPLKPTNVVATQTTEGKVQLSWTAPTAVDLLHIAVLRGKNGATVTGTPYATVLKGTTTYTDSDVVAGDALEYILKSVDTANNASGITDSVKITVVAPAVVEEEAEGEAVEGEEGEVAEGEAVEGEEVAEGEGEGEGEEVGGGAVSEITEVFEDIQDVDWAQEAVSALYDAGIVEGKEEGVFAPNDNLNRAESAAMLYRVLGGDEPDAPSVNPFKDVLKNAWFAGYVAELKAEEIVEGNPDGTFAPAKEINRAEFLTLIMRVYENLATDEELDALDELSETTTHYADLATSWYTATVAKATQLGFVEGSKVGGKYYFKAETTINRAEASQMIYNAFFK